MHRARLLVDGLVAAHFFEENEEIGIGELHVVTELDRVDLFHQVAEHRALPATGGHCLLCPAPLTGFGECVVMATESVSQST